MQAATRVARMGNQFQIFIPHNISQLTGRAHHQQGFFKARDKTRKIFEIAAVFFVGINHQAVELMLLHRVKDMTQA